MISIITPTHKPQPLIELTIKSVFEQTYSDWEWVVLDNSENFYFEEFIYNYCENNPQYKHLLHKVKIFKQHYDEVNIGKLKNECVQLTSCENDEFILLLDHDDFLDVNALYEIHKMQCKYPHADYITGDCIRLLFNNSNFYIEDNFSKLLTYTKFSQFISNEVTINVSDLNIRFPYTENYLCRYFTPNNIECFKNFYDIDIPESYCLSSHPRCLKKQILTKLPYQFYEGHEVSEDTTQLIFMTYFLKGCYIEKNLYYNVRYSDYSNSSWMIVSDECRDGYRNMVLNTTHLISSFLKLYPNYNLFDNFLNKHELNIIDNDN